MSIDLTGKPIVITGASSGIGAATALACARAGMPVAVGARRVDKLDRVVRSIQRAGGRAIAVPTDVSDPEQCAALIQETAARFGTVYGVFANAGYGEEIAVDVMSDQGLRAMFETNFFGSLNIVRPALSLMRQSPGPSRGHVLICSSCLARMTLPYYGAYSATKAAQAHIARAMKFELEPEGIHVSSIHPIGTRTEFFEQVEKVAGKTQLISHSPDAFMQSPEFVARKVVACLRRPRAEVWTGLQGGFVRFGMSVCTMFPHMGNFVLRGMVKRRLRSNGVENGNAAAPL
jgi:NAD(P)-dependent dehydrogenase (short-subunit alcohol dehydrogenase family)